MFYKKKIDEVKEQLVEKKLVKPIVTEIPKPKLFSKMLNKWI